MTAGVDRDLPGFADQSVYRTLYEAYPDALLLVDADGRIVLANPAALRLLGYDAGQLLGLSVDELVPEAIRPRHAAFRAGYGRAPRSRPMGTQMELVARRRDGSEVMVEIALSPLQDHGLPYVVAAVRGIAAYPRVVQALQRARYNEYLAQFGHLAVNTRSIGPLLDRAPRIAAEALQVPHGMVCLLDADRLEFRVAAGVGLLAGQALGSRMANRPDQLAGHVVAAGRPVVVSGAGGEPSFDILPCYGDAGLTNCVAVPLSDAGRAIGVLAVRAGAGQRFGDDEIRFLEALSNLLATSLQRAQSDDALSHAQRLESVGQLSGGIAHDFNNLLTVISGNLQALEDMPAIADDAASRQMIAAAARAARRGAELTNKLLAFSRRQVLRAAPVDVRALLQSLADMLRRTLDQRIRITLEVAPDCPPCLADPGQLEAALLNVSINARDAMPEGGSLTFSAREVAAPPSRLDVQPVESAAGYVAIAIADSGTGMSQEVKERAFEPFYTTKEAGRGTGLGLSTVYGFARQSGGAVALDSMLGAGSTVTLFLPCRRGGGSHARGGTAAAAVPAGVPPGLRVLLVEDDPEVRLIAHSFLDALGCRTHACAGAAQALLLFGESRRPAPFDLLLTDIALGAGMRGTELAELARRRWPELPVLLVSGYSADLLDLPTDRPLLHKPYGRDELANAIAAALRTGGPASAAA